MSCAAHETGVAQAIGLPSSGARVTAATPVAAGGSAPQTFGAYCDVSAERELG